MTALRYLWAVGLNGLFSSLALAQYQMPALTSMQGTMIEQQWVGNPPRPPTNGAEERGKVWSRDDMTRIELSGEPKVISIQRSEVIYVYRADRTEGIKTRVPCCGLGSHGLITQIEEIKKAGKQTETYVHDGKNYVSYEYKDLPTEAAIVKLSVENSLPVWWHSVVYDPNKKISVMHIVYEDLQANVIIPEELFEPPADVTFVEKDFGEVMRPEEDDRVP